MYSLMAGLVLLSLSSFSWVILRDIFHPSFVFSGVWGLGLCAVSLAPYLGFFEVESNALLLYVLGGAIFFSVSMFLEKAFQANIWITRGFFYREINFKKIAYIFILLHLIIFPNAFSQLLKLGGDFEQITYAARSMAVSGEEVFGKITSNYFLVGLVVIPILLRGVATKKVSFLVFLIVSVPWCIFILIGTGRAGLIQMLLGLLVVYRISSDKLPVKVILSAFLVFAAVVVIGAIATNKVDLSKATGVGEIGITFLKHLGGYALQGPILFSLYFDRSIEVFPNWSPFVSLCHLLSALQLCEPLAIHSDFNLYGPGLDGNVYSIYFSIYPNYGYLGAIVFIALYALFTTYAYIHARKGNLFCLVISAYLFAASVLSLFADSFLPSFWFFIKVLCVTIAIILFFSKRSRQIYAGAEMGLPNEK